MSQTKLHTIKKVLPLFIFVMALVASSNGNTIPPGPDWRGNEGSTLQCWHFLGDDPTPAPDVVSNPYGPPQLLVDPHPDNQNPWINDEMPGAVGVWALSGEIDMYIPNRPGGEYKEIWINLRWKGIDDQGGELPYNPYLPASPLVAITPFDYMDMYVDKDEMDDNGWHNTLYIATIWPNPTGEWITIKGNILVDDLCIDTICVPEPATIAMLSIGALLAVRKRKNRR